jgi:NAD-dependent deacetylase
MPQTNYDLAAIAEAWRKAKCPVVFTGAGMSTESGLPDFRSVQGLWRRRPESLATLNALRQIPEEFYFFYQWRIARLREVAPNKGHMALAKLWEGGFLKQLITQNVDGLHQRSGIPDAVELHGTLRTVRCLGCDTGYDSRRLLPERDGWQAEYEAGEYKPGPECRCAKCGGLLRPDVVLFGEALPQAAWAEAVRWSKAADFFVVIGSSLVVGPANLCPQLALDGGAKLVIINREPTHLDSQAFQVVAEQAGDVLAALQERIMG